MPAEAVSGRSGGCSGNLRAAESLRSDDLGSPRGTGLGRNRCIRTKRRRRHGEQTRPRHPYSSLDVLIR